MPIELEYKYVMKNVDNIEKEIINNLNNDQYFSKDIHQIYLKNGGRVREVDINDKTIYEFNYKEPLGKGYGCLEIEKEISKDDFEIAQTAKVSELRKTRICITTKNYLWEIDIFKDIMKQPYFIMMECEVKDHNKPDLTELPEYIQNLIIHKVDLDNKDFTSKKLENIENAKALYRVIDYMKITKEG